MGARAESVAGTRERIALAAMALFLAEPFEDVTLLAIASAAGVSHQTVLNHFESKEGVVGAVAEIIAADTVAARGAATPGDDRRRRCAPWSASTSGWVMPTSAGWPRPSGSRSSCRYLDGRPAEPSRVARRHVRRPPPGGAIGTAASGRERPPRGDRRVHLEAAAPRPRSQPSRDGTNHRRARRRRPGRSNPMSTSDITTRTYLFALVDGGGTVPPELGAVRRLVDRGHHVTVLGEDSMVADVHASGALFRPWTEAPNRASRLRRRRPLPRLGVQDPDGRSSPGSSTASSSVRRRPTPPTSTAAIGERSPRSGRLLAVRPRGDGRRRGRGHPVRRPPAEHLPAPHRRACRRSASACGRRRVRSGRSRDRLITNVLDRQWRKGLAPINELRADHGLAPLGSFLDQVHTPAASSC